MPDFPKSCDDARDRVLGMLNKMVEADEQFVRDMLNARWTVPDAIFKAVGRKDICVVIGKSDDLGWCTSALGVVNGVLMALGCKMVMVKCDLSDGDKFPITKVHYFEYWSGDDS